MQIDSAFGNALLGIRKGQQRMDESAQSIASASFGDRQGQRDATQALVDLQRASQETQVSVKAVRAVDDALGSLIDTEA